MKFTPSLFSQIVHIMPRHSFLQMVHECGAERHTKGFSSWTQYVSMLFCQLAQAKSLREISDGLSVTCGKLSHLGLQAALLRARFPMPTPIAPGICIRTSSSICGTSVKMIDLARREAFVSRTNCSVLTLRLSTCV